MLLYRIAKSQFATDLSGEGARLYGGRWSPAGVSIIHTSESPALACMEMLVHAGSQRLLALADLVLVVYELKDGASIMNIDMQALPTNWRAPMAPGELKEIGKHWVAKGQSLALRVPSAPIPWGRERNVLINPRHPECKDSFAFVEASILSLDDRLLNT